VAVVAASYVLLLALRLLLPRGVGEAAAVAVGLLVLTYCLMRTTRRGDVLASWVAPSAAAVLAHDITGVAPWMIGLPVMLLALAVLAADDHEERAARA
jgi:hypothetical protein